MPLSKNDAKYHRNVFNDEPATRSPDPSNLDDTQSPKALRFAREMRLKRTSCPLCTFVQTELEKGNELPIEEWIYLSHLSAAHEIIP